MSRGCHRPFDFLDYTASKITPVFTSSPLDSQPNTIENVATLFHPFLYIQPNAQFLTFWPFRPEDDFKILKWPL
jgi:hypothetical protein